MDALTLKALAFELNNALKGAKIEKIYQPSAFELVAKTSAGALLLSIHPTHFTANLTTHSFENPSSPSAFAMLLRKHLSKGIISSVEMDGFERILTISIDNTNEMFEPVSFKLVAELMGKHSNIILIDGQNKILESIKHIPLSLSSVRQVLPGLTYFLPPAKEDIPTNLDDNYMQFTGLNRFTKDLLNSGEITVQDCIASIESPAPCVLNNDGKTKLVLSYTPKSHRFTTFNTMSEALDFFYFTKDSHVQSADIIRNVTTILKRLERSIAVHEKNLAADEEKYKLYGELLTGNAHNLKSGMETAVVNNYYTGKDISIPLDKTLSPHENAQRYYKRYSKLKAGKVHAKEQIEIINEQKEYLENVLTFLNNAVSQRDVDACRQELYEQGFFKKSKSKGKNQKLEPITYKTSDGFTVRVGRNSIQNDELTTKKASGIDMWCHVKEIPGSHVIISKDGREFTEQAITEACIIAAYHSKARNSSNVPVDYTLVKYVKKPAHAMPGKVIYTNQKTLFVTPDAAKIDKLQN